MKLNKKTTGLLILTAALFSSVTLVYAAWYTDTIQYAIEAFDEETIWSGTPHQIRSKYWFGTFPDIRINHRYNSQNHRVWVDEGEWTQYYNPCEASTKVKLYDVADCFGSVKVNHYTT